METAKLFLGLLAAFLFGWHVYSAYGFRGAMEKDGKELWQSLGNPNPLAFFWWDIKRFRQNHGTFLYFGG